MNQIQAQTLNNSLQTQAGTVVTPQTANFPAGLQGGHAGGGMATPLSPGSEVRERERVAILLEINRELLLESMRLHAAEQAAEQVKKVEEAAAATDSPDSTGDKDKAEKEKTMKTITSREYFECMRRLQGNLAYLAAIADRAHKPSSQIPAHPAVMSAPPMAARTKKDPHASPSETKTDSEEEKKFQDIDTPEDHEKRIETLRDLYKRLQALFPGVDPKHDVQAQAQAASAAARAQMQAKQKQVQAQVTVQGQSQGEQIPQQKMQAEMYRQQLIQQAQQQAVAAQHNQQAMQHNQSQGR